MSAGAVDVGPAGPPDWAAIRDICCETGMPGGKPIARERRPFFGELWVGPYERLLPGWTFVARAAGGVAGYLTGCPDSLPFYLRRSALHRLPLTAKALLGRFGATEDVRRFLHPLEGLRRSFALRFGAQLYWKLLRQYPAHLHTNVREAWRGAGVGRRLMEAYLGALEAEGVRGLHLFCGDGPVPYYRKVGFEELAALDLGKGVVHVMARRLTPRGGLRGSKELTSGG